MHDLRHHKFWSKIHLTKVRCGSPKPPAHIHRELSEAEDPLCPTRVQGKIQAHSGFYFNETAGLGAGGF